MYYNKAIIFGNLTRDPEQKSLPSGAAVTTFGMATNRVWTDKNGAKQESTDFHNIVVFGRQAETCAQYLRKGATALIEGRITTRSWDDAQSGQKKYRTEIIAERVQFGPRPGGAPGSGAGPRQSDAPQQNPQEGPETIDYPDAASEGINVEDIPF